MIIYSIVPLNEVKLSQNTIKFVFYLLKTKPFLIIYSEYHALVRYFLYCYERGNTLSISFQKSFAIIWYFPSSFYNQNALLLIRNGVVTSEWKYMYIPIDCFCTFLVPNRIKNISAFDSNGRK